MHIPPLGGLQAHTPDGWSLEPAPQETQLDRMRRAFGWEPGSSVLTWSKKRVDELLTHARDARDSWPREGAVLCQLEQRYAHLNFKWFAAIRLDSGTVIKLEHDDAGYLTIPEQMQERCGARAGARVLVEHDPKSKTVALTVDDAKVVINNVNAVEISYVNRPTFNGKWVTLADLLFLDKRCFSVL